MLRDCHEELGTRWIVTRSDEGDFRFEMWIWWNVDYAGIGRGGEKLRAKPVSVPFGFESGNKECAGQSAYRRNVGDVRAVDLAVPLRVVVPHRVRPVADDLADSVGVEGETFGEKDEIWTELASVTQRPVLREPTADEPFGSSIVDEQCLMPRSAERALYCGFHAPLVLAPDKQDPHGLNLLRDARLSRSPSARARR
jgi:hypothetical protein